MHLPDEILTRKVYTCSVFSDIAFQFRQRFANRAIGYTYFGFATFRKETFLTVIRMFPLASTVRYLTLCDSLNVVAEPQVHIIIVRYNKSQITSSIYKVSELWTHAMHPKQIVNLVATHVVVGFQLRANVQSENSNRKSTQQTKFPRDIVKYYW